MEEELKPNDKKRFWRDLWALLKPVRKTLVFVFAFSVVLEAADMLSPYILKLIIDRLTDFDSAEVREIIALIGLFFAAEVAGQVMELWQNRAVFRLLFTVEAELNAKAQSMMVYLSLSYHERENTGNKISKIERGIQKITDLLGNLSWEVVPVLFQLVLTLFVLLYYDWRIALAFAVFAPLFIFITVYSNVRIYPMRKERFKNYEKASGKVGQTIININTVKSFVQEEREEREYGRLWAHIKARGIREWFTMMNFGFLRGVVIKCGRVSTLLLAVYLVYSGNISLGTLVFVMTLSEKAYSSLWRLSRFYDRMEEGAVGVKRFMDVVNAETDIQNPPDGIVPNRLKGEIFFKNVSFKYRDSAAKALAGVSFKIAPDSVTALVGPSGGGKTTAARMVYRHYDPQEGAVLLDGRDLREYDLYAFRRQIAIVPQEVEIFSDTVRNNIAYACPQAGQEEVEAAARVANAHEFISKLAKGYDTEVGERGIKLSGGQRQRVGIARAILADPKVLIFDEATSNLDSESERLIQAAMDRIVRGRTVIIIAHRLSTIRKADRIIVLQDGRVAEEGSHAELAHVTGGLYARLVELQRMGDVT